MSALCHVDQEQFELTTDNWGEAYSRTTREAREAAIQPLVDHALAENSTLLGRVIDSVVLRDRAAGRDLRSAIESYLDQPWILKQFGSASTFQR